MVINGVTIPTQLLAKRCRELGVLRVWLFGSILTDNFTASSDIDILVEVNPAKRLGLFSLGGLADELSQATSRTVHLSLLGGIAEADREGILRSARLLNAA